MKMRSMVRLAASILALLLIAQSVVAESSCLPSVCGLDQSAIDAYPYPNVRPLPIDDGLLYDRDYRQIEGDGRDLQRA